MEKRSEIVNNIEGAEGIVIHNGNIVLGMQAPKRWYTLENGQAAAIIKTLGGQIEEDDEGCSKKALIRELFEEVKGIEREDIRVSKAPIFTKRIEMRDLNPFERQSNLSMKADFYLLKILNEENIMPNDLPALLEIPIDSFLRLEFAKQGDLRVLQDFVIKNDSFDSDLPENYALLIPREVKTFFEKFLGDVER